MESKNVRLISQEEKRRRKERAGINKQDLQNAISRILAMSLSRFLRFFVRTIF